MYYVDLKGALKKNNNNKIKASQKQRYKDIEIPADILH